jgi:hypothetical protein
VDYECCFLPRTSAANHIVALPLKGRLILAFLRALVGAFKAGKTFVAQNTGFGGDLSDVTNLIGEKHLRERSLALAVSRHSR